MTIVAGAYSATWNALAVGNTVQGFEMSYVTRARPISSDVVGQTVIDQIYAGTAMSVDMILQEYDAAAFETMTWWQHAIRGVSRPAGASMFALAMPLVLTACLAGTEPATITFPKTILAPDFDVRILYSHRERYIPVRMLVFPVSVTIAGSVATFGTTMPFDCNPMGYFTET